MKLLFDFIPLVLFFVAYRLTDDIYIATGVAVVSTILHILWLKLKKEVVQKMAWINLGIISVLGGLTIFLHDDSFIKWKPTLLYVFFAVALILGQVLGKSPLRLLLNSKEFQLPEKVWSQMTLSWAAFFGMMAVLNWYIAFHWSIDYCAGDLACAQSTWVQFKVFGTTALLFIFIILQGIFLFKHLPKENKETK